MAVSLPVSLSSESTSQASPCGQMCLLLPPPCPPPPPRPYSFPSSTSFSSAEAQRYCAIARCVIVRCEGPSWFLSSSPPSSSSSPPLWGSSGRPRPCEAPGTHEKVSGRQCVLWWWCREKGRVGGSVTASYSRRLSPCGTGSWSLRTSPLFRAPVTSGEEQSRQTTGDKRRGEKGEGRGGTGATWSLHTLSHHSVHGW